MPSDPLTVARVAIFRHFCDSTTQVLDDFIAEMRDKEYPSIVVAASHLKDSLEVFTDLCERRLLEGDDI